MITIPHGINKDPSHGHFIKVYICIYIHIYVETDLNNLKDLTLKVLIKSQYTLNMRKPWFRSGIQLLKTTKY